MPENKILKRWHEEGLDEKEEVIMYHDSYGKIRYDVMIPDGQFPSPKALEMSRAFNKDLYEK